MSDLNRVVELIKTGDTSQARLILLDILATERQNEQAWLYLAACAENKTEFEQSVLQVLTLNPYNGQAMRLAKSNKIDLPASVKRSQKQEKKRRKAQRKAASSGSSQTRLLLYILLLLVIGAGAYLWMQDATDTSDDSGAVVDADVTAEPTATETAVPTETPSPTQTPSPTPLPFADNPTDYVIDLRVMSGTGASADDLLEDEVFPPDAAINVVIDVESHGDPLTFTIELATLTGATRNARAERTIEASTSETVIVPVTPPGGIWSPGNWAAQVEVNGERMQGVQFRIAESNTTAQNASTPRPSRTPAPDTTATASSTATETPPPTRIPTNTPPPTPTEVPIDPTTRLVYDDETLYIINITEELQDISGLVFVQEITDDDPQEFEALGWQQGSFRGEGSVYALQPDSCFQIGLNSGTAASTPDACVRLSSWQQANVVERFWLAHEDGPEVFLIMLNDEELIECEIAAGECEFELPESEE